MGPQAKAKEGTRMKPAARNKIKDMRSFLARIKMANGFNTNLEMITLWQPFVNTKLHRFSLFVVWKNICMVFGI
jgi:hypothetical protein